MKEQVSYQKEGHGLPSGKNTVQQKTSLATDAESGVGGAGG